MFFTAALCGKRRMPLMVFSVDAASCRHCGICAAGCVCSLIELTADGVPSVPPDRQTRCVHCGHCAASCPAGAITLDGMDARHLEAAGEPVPPSMTRRLLKTRRAIRNFKPEAVDPALLEQILSLAAYAPTAHNARQVSYTVINGRQNVEKLLLATVRLMEAHGIYTNHTKNVRNGHDTLFRGAPCLILLHAPERILSETDCATAASYLELAFPSFHMGSCWAGMLIEACAHGLPEGFALPEGHRLYAALMVGRPDITYTRIPFRSAPDIVWVS